MTAQARGSDQSDNGTVAVAVAVAISLLIVIAAAVTLFFVRRRLKGKGPTFAWWQDRNTNKKNEKTTEAPPQEKNAGKTGKPQPQQEKNSGKTGEPQPQTKEAGNTSKPKPWFKFTGLPSFGKTSKPKSQEKNAGTQPEAQNAAKSNRPQQQESVYSYGSSDIDSTGKTGKPQPQVKNSGKTGEPQPQKKEAGNTNKPKPWFRFTGLPSFGKTSKSKSEAKNAGKATETQPQGKNAAAKTNQPQQHESVYSYGSSDIYSTESDSED